MEESLGLGGRRAEDRDICNLPGYEEIQKTYSVLGKDSFNPIAVSL